MQGARANVLKPNVWVIWRDFGGTNSHLDKLGTFSQRPSFYAIFSVRAVSITGRFQYHVLPLDFALKPIR